MTYGIGVACILGVAGFLYIALVFSLIGLREWNLRQQRLRITRRRVVYSQQSELENCLIPILFIGIVFVTFVCMMLIFISKGIF